MKKLFLITLLMLTVIGLGSQPASATPYIGISLVMDVSGSISSSEFNLQKQGYANAIDTVITDNYFGYIALNVIEFGRNNNQSIGWSLIDSSSAKDSFINSILGLDRNGINTGWTAIGDAITAGDNSYGSLTTSIWTPDYFIIDVTTDGANNAGSNPAIAAQNAVDGGNADAVNALGIGTSMAPNFNYGINPNGSAAFSLLTPDFTTFESAITNKLQQEVAPVPEPTTMLLLGLGLVGLAVVMKKSNIIANS